MKLSVSVRRFGPVGRMAPVLLLFGCSTPGVAKSPAPATQTAPTPRPAAVSAPGAVPALPDRLSDAAYWKLETDISEPGGYFQIEDNYTSNEMEVGQLFTMLRVAGVSGGVFMGVGPEQNFTYIAAIRPKMAFIVDIRRQAVMQHLMFKAMFEMAPTRGLHFNLVREAASAGIDSGTSIRESGKRIGRWRPIQLVGARTMRASWTG